MSELQKKRKGGVEGHRSELEDQLARLDAPIVVFVDDIDRLEVSEIRDVFRLVRLTANFPNLVYVLAFDRVRVENALNEHSLSGRAYLEKIVQVAYDLPAVPRDVLRVQVDRAIVVSLHDAGVEGIIDQARWGDIFAEVVFPLITTMRDVRRFAASIRATARNLEGRIELSDVLALEAVRIFFTGSVPLPDE